MSVHDLLDDLATEAPRGGGIPDAAASWHHARRRRTRRRLTGVAVLAGLLVVVAVGLEVRPAGNEGLPADRPFGPGEGIPSTIYDVHRWLPSLGSGPAPAVAYVYTLSDYERPIALSVDGSYRYLPPAPDEYSDGELSSVAVSPDGLHLALAWSPSGGTGAAPKRAAVYVFDVATGERRGPWLGRGFGSRITGVAWRWDADGLAWEEFRASTPEGWEGTSRVVVLDWQDGTRDLDGYVGPVAWAPDGSAVVAQRAEVGAGWPRLDIVSMDGADPVTLPDSVLGPVVWAPDGRSLAGIQPCGSQSNFAGGLSTCGVDNVPEGSPAATVVVVDAATGHPTSRPLAVFSADASVLGWRGGTPVLGGGAAGVRQANGGWSQPYVVLQDPTSSSPIQVTESGEPRYVGGVVAAQQLLATAPVVDVPPPSQPRFGPTWWAYLWDQRPAAVVVLALAASGGLLLTVSLTRRSLRRRRPALPS